jgi:hypothetical protein
MSAQSELYPRNHKNASIRSWLHLRAAVLTELWGCRNRRYLFSKVFRLRLRRSTPAVGEDLFFIGKLFIKQALRLLHYHISFVEKFQQKYTVSQVVKKHPYLCTMN